MPTYVGRARPADIVGFEELVDEFDQVRAGPADPEDFRRLFVGEPGETAAESAARSDVAREVFADLMADGASSEIDRVNATYAAWLLCTAPPWDCYGDAGSVQEAA